VMEAFDDWAHARAHEGRCDSCDADVLVATYPRNTFAPDYNRKPTMELCWICTNVVGVNAAEYPNQHPHHQIIKPVLGALSFVFYELRKPKKPRKQRQGRRIKKVELHEMTRRT
jgi:hypothetical protein